MENRKELIKRFRSVASGNHMTREFLLAYAYLRGVPYVVLEKKINEDNFPREPGWEKHKYGLFGVLASLAYSGAVQIVKAQKYLNGENKEDFKRVYKEIDPLSHDIYQWMLVKYDLAEVKAKEDAA